MAILLCDAESHSDLIAFITIHIATTSQDQPYLWYSPPSEASIKAIVGFQAAFLRLPGRRLIKAVDTEKEGEIVGFAAWEFPSPSEDSTLQLKSTHRAAINPGDEEAPKKGLAKIPEQNTGARAALDKQNGRAKEEVMGHRVHIHLGSIAVRPGDQGRGIGTTLVKWGIEEAERLRVPIYLNSTAAGRKLYHKLGFQSKKTIEIDLSEFGGPSTDIRWAMLREPCSNREENITKVSKISANTDTTT